MLASQQCLSWQTQWLSRDKGQWCDAGHSRSITCHIAVAVATRRSKEAHMEIYEVELCRRGRGEQQAARFVAARDANEPPTN